MSVGRQLLYRAPAAAGQDTVITPMSAGWTYAGLQVMTIKPGTAREVNTGSTEMAVLPLAGSCVVECEGARFELAGRPDVFSAVSDFAYLPIDCEARITSDGGGRFALPSAEAAKRLSPAYGPAGDVPVEIRGAGSATRQINNFMEPSAFPADKLIAVEVLTPGGNWSSYPPHKHDEQREGEVELEEIYYFEMSRYAAGYERSVGQGFALQRVYSADGVIDLCEEVHHGDVVLIPRGYHGPSVAPPGYDLYYLNVLAGPGQERAMTFCDDPVHHWLRESWSNEAPDPRLPMTSAARRKEAAP
ncbi:MAG: 5-deoxy-glucuronate isomerase [Acidimicrobiales bacterium]